MPPATATAPSGLQFVVPHDEPNLNVLLYGPAKTGKTIGASSAPGPILYVNGDRPNATRLAHQMRGEALHEVRPTGLQTLVDVVNELKDGDYRSVVIDPIQDLYRVVLDDLSDGAVNPHLNLRGDAGVYIERFLRRLCELPINAVFVAHELIVAEDEGSSRIPFVTSKSGSDAFAAKLMAMVDVFGYTGVQPGEGGEPDRYLAQLVDGGGRRGGSRFPGLGRAPEIDISAWAETIKNTSTRVDTNPKEDQDEG